MKKGVTTKNVFTALGFGPQEAANLQVRARLMTEIETYIRAQRLTKKEAAVRLGVTQPRVSNLLRGKIGLFSTDALIIMLANAGIKVDVRVNASVAA
jgi:predicted XRE-type DNA-binding protein